MAVNCCIVGCTSIFIGTYPSLAFPKKSTTEYKKWIAACKGSESIIRRLKNPLICPLHFPKGAIVNGKLLPNVIPSQLLGENRLVLNHEMASINQLIAEWLTITREKIPDMLVDSNLLKAKAKEVACILRMKHFDVELGWLESFESFLNQNGIQHWESNTENWKKDINENVLKKPVTKEFDIDLGENEVSTMLPLDSEQTIQTYGQALEKVKLLQDYVKRTQNKNAIELVAHLQEILANTLE